MPSLATPPWLGAYLLAVTATSPPCPSVGPTAPSAARSGSSPRDPTPQPCDAWSLQRRLPHLQLLPPLLTHPARPKTPFSPPLTSEGTRVQTCSSEAREGAERQDCGGGGGTGRGGGAGGGEEVVQTGAMWGQELADKEGWERSLRLRETERGHVLGMETQLVRGESSALCLAYGGCLTRVC